MITALAVCHNVTPVYPIPGDLESKELQASSPDEVALVRFADSLNMRLMHRDQQNLITIKNAAGFDEVSIFVFLLNLFSTTKSSISSLSQVTRREWESLLRTDNLVGLSLPERSRIRDHSKAKAKLENHSRGKMRIPCS